MDILENPFMWGSIGGLLLLIGFIILIVLTRKNKVQKFETTNVDNDDDFNPLNDDFNGETNDQVSNVETEDFGMYTGALPDWLSRFDVKRYTNTNKNLQMNGLDSVNQAIQLTESDYIPYDAYNRFQTPTYYTPQENPQFNYNIRTKNV
jgi:hypothetical protein